MTTDTELAEALGIPETAPEPEPTATLADVVRQMAGLVAQVKKDYRLTETTIMRIVDMNVALHEKAKDTARAEAQQAQFDDAPIFPGIGETEEETTDGE